MNKNIYLEPDEEIVSVIDRLVQADAKQVNLVIPTGAQIWQSSINLRLLKREADNLTKEVTLIVQDDLGAELAKKIGFAVKYEKDFLIEPGNDKSQDNKIIQETKNRKEDMIELLVEELKPEKKTSQLFGFFKKNKEDSEIQLASSQTSGPRKRMADIVSPSSESQKSFLTRRFSNKKSKVKPLKQAPVIKQAKAEPTISTPKVSLSSSMPIRLTWSKFFTFFIVSAFVIAIVVAYLAVPSAEVTICPKTEKLNFDLSIVGSVDISQIDVGLNKIPLHEIEIAKTKSKEFSATEEKQMNEKARGFITIYNEYSSSPQTLMATTRFESPEGKVFRIMKAITVPGAEIEEGRIIPSAIDVEVVADEPGESYNIGSTNFTIPGFKGTAKYAGFYAKSRASMSGGSTGVVKIVSADDIKSAEDVLIEELKRDINRALEEQIPTELQIVEDGIKEEIFTKSGVEEGDQADRFNLEMNITVRVLLFKEESLRELINLNLASMISEDKEPVSETQQIEWIESVIDWEKEEAFFDLSIKEDVVYQVDIQSLKNNLTGQSEVEVRKFLAIQPEIEKAKVTFWPFWVKKMPTQEKKIRIELNQDI